MAPQGQAIGMGRRLARVTRGTSRTCPRARRGGITLVEILVVVGIIVVLVAMVLPVLRTLRERAAAATCSTNQRQLMTAFITFAADHDGHLPGNWWDYGLPDPDQRAWLLNYGQPWTEAPQSGTIFKYVGGNREVYRCPWMQVTFPNAQTGSNDRFDYAAFLCFSGARLANIPKTSRFRHPGGRVEELPTPIICEEEPAGGINGGNLEGGHCASDRIAHHHRGGGHYASVDGSVHWFKEPLNADTRNWETRSPKGIWVDLDYQSTPTWGWWNGQ